LATVHQRNAEGATRWLSEQALDIHYGDLPPGPQRIVKHCIIDWYAVTLAAIGEPGLRPLIQDAEEEGGHPRATAAGMSAKTGLYTAALLNGTTSHVLDYDDVNLAITGHPTAVIYSALLPLAESRHADGRALLSAFAAGYETACRVGRWLGDAHYEHGYHATSSVGAVAAAAACANLMGLSIDQTACALGLAATQAAGLKAQFGTMAKPLHAGLAARNGLMSACLAARGYEGGRATLEAAQGYAQVLSPMPDWVAATAQPPGHWHLQNRLFKYHAACYGTNAGIECARELRAEGVEPAQIAAITVLTHPSTRNMCHLPMPRTAAEARFSLRLNIAFALQGIDTGDIAAYTDARLNDAAIVALRDMIKTEFSEALGRMEAEVIIELRDGAAHRRRKDASVPAADIDAEQARICGKYRTLAVPVLGAHGADSLLQQLLGLPGLQDTSVLATPLATPAS